MSKLPARLQDLDVDLAFDQDELARRFDLDELAIDRANAAMKRASADTHRAWQSDWKRWLKFCRTGCLDFPDYRELRSDHSRRRPIPADPRLVRDFIRYNAAPKLTKQGDFDMTDKPPRASTSLKPATLSRIVSTISKAHELYGLPNPCKDSIVTNTLATYSVRRKQQKYANAIRWNDIAEFFQIDPLPPEVLLPNTKENQAFKKDLDPLLTTEGHWLRTRALLTMAYSTMLRREELVGIDVDHIRNEDVIAELHAPYVKGGESDERHVSAVALNAYRAWLRFTEITEGPVFCQLQRNGQARLRKQEFRTIRGKKTEDGKPLRKWVYCKDGSLHPHGRRMKGAEVSRIFKAAMRAIGKPEDFVAGVSGHSCRRGATMDLEAAGKTGPQIMAAGGWKTPTMPARYTKGMKTRTGAMAQLAEAQQTKEEA